MDPERADRWRVWMVAAQEGDAEAYEKLLVELIPTLRGLVRARVWDPDAVEDVVQNILLSIHRARHTYRPERPLLPWVRAVARNAVFDHIRERKRRQSREDPWNEEEVPAVAEKPAGREALSPRLTSALATLPPAQRQAVELLHVRGLTVAEAAARVGVTPGALKVRAHRGYRALRALLQEEHE